MADLPHSREAEESVLGALLLDPTTAPSILDQLEWDDFYFPAHQAFFEAIRCLKERGTPLDAVTVAEALRRSGDLNLVGGVEAILRMIDTVPSPSGADHYVSIVVDRSRRRRLILSAEQTAFRANDLSVDLASISPEPGSGGSRSRRLVAVPMSEVKILPVRWTWEDRIPVGEVTMTAGLGGIGKSTFHAWLLAQVTRGTLPGVHHGSPKSAVVVATEDSYARTVAPRLAAAGAAMERVFRVDALEEGSQNRVNLPRDIAALKDLVSDLDVAVVSLDPLMTLIASDLDTHKDHPLRRALEPLHALADATRCAVVGNGHFNKSSGADPLMRITGSAAFGQVVRAVIAFAHDPDTDTYVVSQAKNNLGRMDLPSLAYKLEPVTLETEEGPTDVTRLAWTGDAARSVKEILADRADREPGALETAMEWLQSVLSDGPMRKSEIVRFAKAEDISVATLQRARAKLGIVITQEEHTRGRPSTWALPDYISASDLPAALIRNPKGFDQGKLENGSGSVSASDGDTKGVSQGRVEPLPEPFEQPFQTLADEGMISCEVCGDRPQTGTIDGRPLCGAHR